MAWLTLVAAGILEAGSRSASSLLTGSRGWPPTVLFAAFAEGSFGLLTLGLRHLEAGLAYGVWSDRAGRRRDGHGRDADEVVPG